MWVGLLFVRVSYYTGDLETHPNLKNCPCVGLRGALPQADITSSPEWASHHE